MKNANLETLLQVTIKKISVEVEYTPPPEIKSHVPIRSKLEIDLEKYETRWQRAKKAMAGLGVITGLAGIIGGAYDIIAHAGKYITIAGAGSAVGAALFGFIYYITLNHPQKDSKPALRNPIKSLGTLGGAYLGAIGGFIGAPLLIAINNYIHNPQPIPTFDFMFGGTFGGMFGGFFLTAAIAGYLGAVKEDE